MAGRLPRLAAVVLTVLAGCTSASGGGDGAGDTGSTRASTSVGPQPPASAAPTTPAVDVLPGMPPVVDPANVYSETGPTDLTPAARGARPLVYVPHSGSGEVVVIDPATFQVVDRFPAGTEVQHVVPNYDMTALYATDDIGNTITPIDPTTGAHGDRIPVIDPYNMYFLPDGSAAVSVAEARKTLVFYDWRTWQEQGRLEVPECGGIDHAEFTPDGRTAVFTCEFAGRVAVVDVASRTLLRMIDMPTRNTHMGPQDIKLSPDGQRFYIADSDQGSLWVLDGAATQVIGEIPIGAGTHGIYPSRDASVLYVTARIAGTVTVLDPVSGAVKATWSIPGGSPDMGGVTADGSQLWLSGRYSKEVYVLSTVDGRLLARIPVGDGPHGLSVWPQPGRYSLGHTGVTR